MKNILLLFTLMLLNFCNRKEAKEFPLEDKRFTKVTLIEGLEEPYELAIANNGELFFIQRHGKIMCFNTKTNNLKEVGSIPVHTNFEDGLVGFTLDPHFEKNKWMYFFYSPKGEVSEYRVSRFTLENDQILHQSEKIMLKIPSQREDCCHTGGSLKFDNRGNLFISVGDNTTPFKSDGYAPLDERIGSISRDDQRTAANSNDLRGKILRITPTEDGGYAIPDSNLFPKDGSLGRPEIYVMGNRNPFRISVDMKKNWLYWGEIGPDAGENSPKGPKGYDEINQAKKAGNYGWPYFIADNKPYAKVDFSTEKIGAIFDPKNPVNNSINNTGTKVLPEAQKAFIWYPYVDSKEFPAVGEGGRSAMAGPVYYYNQFPENPEKLPKQMDGVFFIYDWMRDWILSVRLKQDGSIDTLENHFSHIHFSHPMEVEMGNDGSIYVIEYGYKWWSQDQNTQISRLFYDRGNRTPLAKIIISDSIGSNQLKVKFKGEESTDLDGDKLSYQWKFTSNEVESYEKNPTYTFIKPGIYPVSLTVKDPSGKTSTTIRKIIVGNHRPEITITTNQNSSFYQENIPLNYTISGIDREEGKIKDSKINIFFKYLAIGQDVAAALGHQVKTTEVASIDYPLINKSDCKACHQMKDKSVGPSFYEISLRYKRKKDAIEMLANKIIKGGGGNWGDHAMSAHPTISLRESKDIVNYILGVTEGVKSDEVLLSKGTLRFEEHLAKNTKGSYYLSASYTDKGIGSLTGQNFIKLRNTYVYPDQAEIKSNIHVWGSDGVVEAKSDQSYFAYKDLDLTGVKSVEMIYSSLLEGSSINMYLDDLTSKPIATLPTLKTGKENEDKLKFVLPQDIKDKHTVYFLYDSNKKKIHNMMIFRGLRFVM